MSATRRELEPRERAILDFERDWTGRMGGKDDAIRAAFGITSRRYYALLANVLDDPAAAAYDPFTVKRLRRDRAERRRRRVARQLGLSL